MVHELGELFLLDRRTVTRCRSSTIAQAPWEPVLALDLPPGALRNAAVDVVDVRALLPLVHVHERTEPVRILDSLQKTVARVSVSSPAVVSVHGTRTPLRAASVCTPSWAMTRSSSGLVGLRSVRCASPSRGSRSSTRPFVPPASRPRGAAPRSTCRWHPTRTPTRLP